MSASNMVDERALAIMLQPKSVAYLKRLRREIAKDPNYLSSHSHLVGGRVQKILSNGGIHWHKDILEREWQDIVREAISRV